MLFFVGLFSIPFSVLLRGWVLASLWTWFIVPIGVPSVGVLQAVGIAILGQILLNINKIEKEKPDLSQADEYFKLGWMMCDRFCYPLLWYGLGWIIHAFM